MTFHNFTDGDVLYATQLNALRAHLEAYADGSFWRGTIPTTGSLDTALEPGLYGYWSGSANAPDAVSGVLLVGKIGNTTQQKAWAYGSNPREFHRYSTIDSPFSEWIRVDGGDRLTALEQDTGWRDITGLINAESIDASNLGTLRLRRIGHLVTVTMQNVVLTQSSYAVFVTLGSGYRPGTSLMFSIDVAVSSSVPIENYQAGMNSAGAIYVTGYPGRRHQFTLTYITDEAFPTSLPGLPA
ncbi:pyocin knob domain-containing protein [Agrococcus casei]|nr:pyocin knob domain-containing protein [Agrococcus casei]